MHYELVQCTEADREWAYALKCEVYREVIERQFGPWNETFQREHFISRWAPSISKIIIQGGRRVGLLALIDSEGTCLLDELQVSPESQGRGLGSSIVRDLIEYSAREKKILRLEVLKENFRAQALYRKLGFSRSGETTTHMQMTYAHCSVKDGMPNLK